MPARKPTTRPGTRAQRFPAASTELHERTPEDRFAASFLPAGKLWFSIVEAAQALGVSPSFMRLRIEDGLLPVFRYGTGEKRQHGRLHRDHLALFLLRTGRLDPDAHLQVLAELAAKLPPPYRQRFRQILDESPPSPR